MEYAVGKNHNGKGAKSRYLKHLHMFIIWKYINEFLHKKRPGLLTVYFV